MKPPPDPSDLIHQARAAHLPVVIDAKSAHTLTDLPGELHPLLATILGTVGGVLLRGFRVSSPLEFRRFAESFGSPLASYEFGSTPRTRVLSGVYSSTEYPSHQEIPLHNEQSYTRVWPRRIWFHCMRPSEEGGETPIADSRAVLAAIPRELRDRWAEREVLYVRNFLTGLDVPWQKVFGTNERAIVEKYCAAQQIEWEWTSAGDLRTRQRCPAILNHPETGECVWFNQAHLFHASALEPSTRAALMASIGPANLPRNALFGDGSPIPDADLEVVRRAYRDTEVVFPWQAGDVLMLDNLLVAHGRRPFGGNRKLIVAMA